MKETTHHLRIRVKDDGSAAAHNPTVLCAALRGALECGIGSFVLDSFEVDKLAKSGFREGLTAGGGYDLPPVVTAHVAPTLDRDEMVKAMEKAWLSRAAAQNWKPGTATYAKHEVEFFTGATGVLQALFPDTESPSRLSSAVPPLWIMRILSGRPVVQEGKVTK